MHAVLIGGAGFIGLNIAEALLTRGHHVTVLDRVPIPAIAKLRFADLPGELRTVVADVSDAATLNEAFADGADLVVLGAAITADAARDAREPQAILAVNLLGIVPILQAARAAKVRRVINLSSVAALGRSVFGPQSSGLLDETVLGQPESLYAITKLATEQVCARLAQLWPMDIVSVRLSAAFGPWERFGGLRDTVSPQLQVMAALERQEPASFAHPGFRDWVYSVDVAEAVITLAESEALAHRLYHVSTPHRSSALAFAEAVAADHPGFDAALALPGHTATIDIHAQADRLSLDVGRIKAETGWQARFTPSLALDHYSAWWRQFGPDMLATT